MKLRGTLDNEEVGTEFCAHSQAPSFICFINLAVLGWLLGLVC